MNATYQPSTIKITNHKPNQSKLLQESPNSSIKSLNTTQNRSNQPILHTVQQKSADVHDFQYRGLPRFDDDTDLLWEERCYSMASYFHQYTNISTTEMKSNLFTVGPLSPTSVSSKDLLYITGCSSNHFQTNLIMLLHLLYEDFNAPIVFISFGLTAKEKTTLFSLFNFILTLRQQLYSFSAHSLYYREINWTANPSFLRTPHYATIYDLKAISTVNIAEECQCKVFWLDAGDFVGSKFLELNSMVAADGIRSRRSRGPISVLTQKSMLHWFQHKVPSVQPEGIMCSSGFVGLDYHNEEVWTSIALLWRECLYRPKCIFSKYANKWNHRYEQSALSILVNAYQKKRACSFLSSDYVVFQGELVLKQAGYSNYTTALLNKLMKRYRLSAYRSQFNALFLS